MRESVAELMNRFTLERLEDNLFRGQTEANGQRSIFGGLVAGQALLAASMTVSEDRPAHSLHAYFLRPGDIRVPVIYDVDRIRDGKSFTTRRVNAIQHGRPIFSLSASFQVEEEGGRHQNTMPDRAYFIPCSARNDMLPWNRESSDRLQMLSGCCCRTECAAGPCRTASPLRRATGS